MDSIDSSHECLFPFSFLESPPPLLSENVRVKTFSISQI